MTLKLLRGQFRLEKGGYFNWKQGVNLEWQTGGNE